MSSKSERVQGETELDTLNRQKRDLNNRKKKLDKEQGKRTSPLRREIARLQPKLDRITKKYTAALASVTSEIAKVETRNASAEENGVDPLTRRAYGRELFSLTKRQKRLVQDQLIESSPVQRQIAQAQSALDTLTVAHDKENASVVADMEAIETQIAEVTEYASGVTVRRTYVDEDFSMDEFDIAVPSSHEEQPQYGQEAQL